MKKPASIVASIALALASVSPVLAWGPDGHETVGEIASLRIKQHTQDRIAQILKPGETVANVSNWADFVKDHVGEHDPDPDTDAFLQDVTHNKNTREWHFDDLPLGCTSYNTCNGFTPASDIVHLINICIRTLQGQPDPNQPLSKRNALRFLVHFLGDIHQPLHVGSGYVNENGPHHTIVIATDPAAITQNHFPNDRGANLLIIDGQQKNLHSFWDGDLVKALMTFTHQQNSDALGQFLKTTVTPQTSWNAEGAIDTWAAQFATDSLNQSRNHAYKSVKIVGKRTIISHGQPQTVYDITRASNYNTLNRTVVKTQLAKAGFRLAALLDQIFAN
jgi:S1/P1 Nuclease